MLPGCIQKHLVLFFAPVAKCLMQAYPCLQADVLHCAACEILKLPKLASSAVHVNDRAIGYKNMKQQHATTCRDHSSSILVCCMPPTYLDT